MAGGRCVKFGKRLDPSLPFYYYSTTDRFYDGDLPSFDKAPEKPKKQKRAPRREQLGANVGRWITMAPRGTSSIRATFHNFLWTCPLYLPLKEIAANQSYMIIDTDSTGGFNFH